jgi:PKD repeat protein
MLHIQTLTILKFNVARILQVAIASFAACTVSAQTRTLRIVCYNIEADTGSFSTPRPGLVVPYNGGSVLNGGVLEGIGEEIVGSDPAQPLDILALQETTGNNITVAPIVNALNSYYNSPGMYALSTFQATSSGGISSGGGPNALVYNTRTVQLLASVPVDPPGGTSQLGSSSGEYREVVRYEFAPAGVTPTAANEFYVYVSHYKASTGPANETARAGEAQIIRNDSATLPANARILYVGDYNPTGGSSEVGYQTIIAPGINQGIDPMNPSGVTGIDWSTNSLMDQKTESAPDLRYRDDLQIMTTNVFYGQPGGLALVPGTYHVFGNNGTTPYQGSVSVGNSALSNLAVGAPIDAATLYRDLTNAADHLPVVADYTIPVPVVSPVAGFNATPRAGAAPLSVSFANLSTGATNFSWSFGDGKTGTLTNVANTYSNAGSYIVTLTAIGPGGTNVLTRAGYIVVTNPPLPALKLVNFVSSLSGGFQFSVSNLDGTPVTWPEQLRIGIVTAIDPAQPLSNWNVLPNPTLLTNGILRVSDTNAAAHPKRFYRAIGTP